MDSLNSEVGNVESLRDGIVSRSVGGDQVLLYANAGGFLQGPVTFFHLTAGCTGERHVSNVNGPGLMFLGQVFGSSVVYSRVVDPRNEIALMVVAAETVETNEELSGRGRCDEYGEPIPMSLGPAVVVLDPVVGGLRPPFSVR